MNTARFLTSSAILLFICDIGQSQGPLTPTGAPAPTMKTLDQIEPRTAISSIPFTIIQPGSYYLTKNLTISQAGFDGITIQTDNVTIDMRGFTLDGASVGNNGITTNGTNYNGLQVRNGNLQNWKVRGIDFQYSFSSILENLEARNNSVGIYADNGSITRCVANFNTSVGIETAFCNVRDCATEVNPVGIQSFSCTIKDCRVGDSTDTGISADRSVVQNCLLDQNRYGIVVQTASNVHDNTVLYSGSDGIRLLLQGSTIADNNVFGSGTTVSSSGIWCPGDNNRIVRNNVTNNTGLGIGVVGKFNTIDGNSVLENTNIGISVAGLKNTVVRNMSLGNDSPVTNYSIGTGNNPGPVDAANASTNSWSNTQ